MKAAYRSAAVRRSDELFRRALTLVPGGVNSPVRAFGAVGGAPPFVERGEGPYLVDVDGRRYVDLVCSWGAVLLGHAHPAVVDAVRVAAGRGTGFGAPTEAEVELAAAVAARLPWLDRIRLVSTGTEAAMTAVRLARGWTGRDVVVKFDGCYHGHSDALLAAAGSGVLTFGLPGTPGVTRGAAQDTLVLPYNDQEALRTVFEQRGHEVACVIAESVPANMGVVPPQPGWSALLRELTEAHGALLVLDEVITGFRVAPGGWAQLDGVVPDLVVLGKVLGGGLPLAAVGGRADVMDHLAPAGPVYQAGTLSGNPVAVAAGRAVLATADEHVYAAVGWAAERVARVVADALHAEGVPHVVNRAGSLFSVFFTDQPVTDRVSAGGQSTAAFAAFFHAMLDRGVYLPPSAFEAWFVTAAHDDEALDLVAAAAGPAARAARAAA